MSYTSSGRGAVTAPGATAPSRSTIVDAEKWGRGFGRGFAWRTTKQYARLTRPRSSEEVEHVMSHAGERYLSPPASHGGRITRRSCLMSGALGALGLSLADVFRMRRAQAHTVEPRASSVILIYAMGGISHHDTFDPKPDAPVEVRGEFRPIATRLPSVFFSDHVPLLAQCADRFALIRSVHHNQTCHGVGAYYMLRGYTQPDPTFDRPENQYRANPTIGSQVARLFGFRNGLPPYICVPGLSYLATIDYYTAGWLGRAYDPYVTKSDPSRPDFNVSGLALESQILPDRLEDRFNLLSQLDGLNPPGDPQTVQSVTVHYEKAHSLLTSNNARRAFDVAAESDRTRDAYGRSRLGQSCLIARRLVEAGVPFVTVDDDGWDHHGGIFPGLRQRLPELDQGLAAMLRDLAERGLLEKTLVVLLTDFGRTPKINAGAGRDHWPRVFSVLVAGAGIPGGQVIGASDRIGGDLIRAAVSPKDLAATFYHFLGIDPFQEYKTADGRPMRILDEGRVVRGL